LSVGAAVAGSITPNFCAAGTDRPLLVDITQSLTAGSKAADDRYANLPPALGWSLTTW